MEEEKFADAVSDFKSALAVKQDLYPEENTAIAEAHYWLSLALEFASNIVNPAAGGDDNQEFDQKLRDEAVAEMQAAIKSAQLRIQKQEVELASSLSPDDNDIMREEIADVKSMVEEMQGRLVELRKPPVDVAALKDAVFGQALGGTKADADAKKDTATDVSNLVRHKPKTNGTNGKRKAEEEPEVESKKAKVEDAEGAS